MYRQIFFVIFAIAEAYAYQQRVPCKIKQVEYGQVCVNDLNYCDTLEVPLPKSRNDYTLVTSSLSGDRFSYEYGNISPSKQLKNIDNFLEIDRQKCGSEFVGFGGGFSGGVSYILNRLPENIRKCVYKSYFTSNVGMGLSMLLLSIGGTSSDDKPWTYSETPVNDTSLSHFTQLDPRDVQRNGQIKEIMNIAKHTDFKIISSAKSAPPWMKGNNAFGGGVNSQVKEEYYQTWANYHEKYLYYMRLNGIPIWAITTGDEPVVGTFVTDFIFMAWNASDQARWIANYLGPMIKNSSHKKVKILVFEENRSDMLNYLAGMEAGAPEVMKYAYGIGLHGHVDSEAPSTVLDRVHEKYPDLPILMTQKSFGIGNVPIPLKGVLFGSWQRAENLTVELIDNLNHGVTAYLYWNFILDNLGGPNYAKNYIDSPIIVDESYTAMYKQPMFYAFAHFAKFIPVGSKKITAKLYGIDVSLINAVAYLCPDGSISMVLYNVSGTKTVTLHVIDKAKEIRLVLKPKSINTLIY